MATLMLRPVEEYEGAELVLYALLKEREGKPEVNISHKSMPTFEEHAYFVANHPYEAWYIIEDQEQAIGSVYLTKPPKPSVAGNEIGIFIFKQHHGKGYGTKAIEMIMEKHPLERYLANINPDNYASIKLFEKMGFKLCQYTFEKMG